MSLRENKVAFLDIDKTLYRGGEGNTGYLITDTIGFLVSHRLLSTEGGDRTFKCHERRRDHPDEYPYEEFAADLLRAFGYGLVGQDPGELREAYGDFVDIDAMAFAFARPLIGLLKAREYHPIAISGSQEGVVEVFASSIGINEFYATAFEVGPNGLYTGKILVNRAIHDSKKRDTERIASERSLKLDHCAGFGDSAGDAFLRMVGYPVAVMPNDELREIVEQEMVEGRRWLIIEKEEGAVEAVAEYLPE